MGTVPREAVELEEMNKVGRTILSVLDNLLNGGSKPPFPPGAVLLTATEVLGVNKEALKQYLRVMIEENVGAEAGAILQKVRDKQLMVDVLNETTSQLQKGLLDVGAITALCSERKGEAAGGPTSVSEALKNGLPDPPVGIPIDSLPTLTKATGGIIGMWAIAGQSGIGKSALAWQILIDAARSMPAIVYDFENGFPVLMDRLRYIFKGDVEKIREAMKNVYLRESIRTLDQDLNQIPAPAVVVVDSVQKLPTSVTHKTSSLDSWVHRLEALKKRGYSVVLVSEIPRSQYDAGPSMSVFKQTGEIEYAADAGMQLIPTRDLLEVHIVKNRHRPSQGHITTLRRRNDWWFKEAGGGDILAGSAGSVSDDMWER